MTGRKLEHARNAVNHIFADLPDRKKAVMVAAMDKLSIPTPQDIQERARSKGWSIKRLCDEAGISFETFFRWRDGKHHIQVNKLQALLDALERPD